MNLVFGSLTKGICVISQSVVYLLPVGRSHIASMRVNTDVKRQAIEARAELSFRKATGRSRA